MVIYHTKPIQVTWLEVTPLPAQAFFILCLTDFQIQAPSSSSILPICILNSIFFRCCVSTSPPIESTYKCWETFDNPNMSTELVERVPFSFFWLPAAIRCLIYQHLSVAPGDVVNRLGGGDPFHRRSHIYPSILGAYRTI